MKRSFAKHLKWILPALLVVALAMWGADAFARVGGGQSFGTGSHGGGGSYHGGGGGGDNIGLIIYFLIRLCIEYPAVGIPLTIIFLLVLGARFVMDRPSRSHRVHRARDEAAAAPPPSVPRPTRGLDALEESDHGFSMPVLQEFLELVQRRALEAVGTGEWDPLVPFVSEGARNDLSSALAHVKSIEQVVHGGLRVEQVTVRTDRTILKVLILGSRLEHLADGGERRMYFEERWGFRRKAGATSLKPEDMLRLGCPSCGAAIETDTMGRCTQCGTPITKGQLQWQATDMSLLVHREFQPPEVGFFAGGDEPSVSPPTRTAGDLATAFKRFAARHPDFEMPAFENHVREVFVGLQQAWSDGEWSRARPWCTDPMYQNLRFYMEQYAAGGLHNRLDDIDLQRIVFVRVQQDAWYEAITVRLWASMKDWVEDADSKVIGGNAKVARRFSEYWTFLRASGSGGGTSKDAQHCPSCGAPLDKVSAAGVCGYCGTKITTGHFDWVLSRIDQVETYQG